VELWWNFGGTLVELWWNFGGTLKGEFKGCISLKIKLIKIIVLNG